MFSRICRSGFFYPYFCLALTFSGVRKTKDQKHKEKKCSSVASTYLRLGFVAIPPADACFLFPSMVKCCSFKHFSSQSIETSLTDTAGQRNYKYFENFLIEFLHFFSRLKFCNFHDFFIPSLWFCSLKNHLFSRNTVLIHLITNLSKTFKFRYYQQSEKNALLSPSRQNCSAARKVHCFVATNRMAFICSFRRTADRVVCFCGALEFFGCERARWF